MGEVTRRVRGLLVDFYCREKKLVVEIDGSSHDNKYEHDKARDEYFNSAPMGRGTTKWWRGYSGAYIQPNGWNITPSRL